jgi:DsbC/DsbD-like thiol-disulfide interchange protein
VVRPAQHSESPAEYRQRRDLEDGRVLLLLLLLLLLLPGACAEGPSGEDRQESGLESGPGLLAASLESEQTAAVPGDTLYLGVQLDIAAGWHVYWRGRSDSGSPVEVSFAAPEGYRPLPLLWPAPERHISTGGILDHVYEKSVLLIEPVLVPSDEPLGRRATFTAAVTWVACNEICRVGSDTLALTLPVAARATGSAAAGRFAQTRSRLPVALTPERMVEDGITTRWLDAGGAGSARLEIAVSAARGIAFYPDQDAAELVDPLADAAGNEGRLSLAVRRGEKPLAGILAVERALDKRNLFYTLEIPIPHPGS